MWPVVELNPINLFILVLMIQGAQWAGRTIYHGLTRRIARRRRRYQGWSMKP